MGLSRAAVAFTVLTFVLLWVLILAALVAK
jgi:hypothetical protein